MKKMFIVLAVLAFAGYANAAQDTAISEKEVRNPKVLKTFLESNALDAESRLTSGSATATNLTLYNSEDAGSASLYLKSDKGDDAGDLMGVFVTGDGSGMLIQSDKSSKGTLATKAIVGDDGLISTLVGFDAIGAVDMDYGSADVVDHVFTSDGGAVTLDGSVTAGEDLVSTDDVSVGDDIVVTGLATVGETLAVTGESTFTGKTIHNLGIDADYITVDAGAGIDNAAAGALKIGESTATSIEIADVGVATAVEGALTVASTLAVTGASTLTGAATISGAASVRGATTLNTLAATGAVTMASTLGVTGVATLTATPVLLNGLTVNTNATIGGTAVVSGNTTLNGTLTIRTNAFTVSATGVGVFADDVTMDKPIFSDAITAAPTNALSAGFLITIQGTNYWLGLYPVND